MVKQGEITLPVSQNSFCKFLFNNGSAIFVHDANRFVLNWNSITIYRSLFLLMYQEKFLLNSEISAELLNKIFNFK